MPHARNSRSSVKLLKVGNAGKVMYVKLIETKQLIMVIVTKIERSKGVVVIYIDISVPIRPPVSTTLYRVPFNIGKPVAVLSWVLDQKA